MMLDYNDVGAIKNRLAERSRYVVGPFSRSGSSIGQTEINVYRF